MLILLLAADTAVSALPQGPMLLGVDNAGSDWRYKSDCPLADDPAIARALKELGVNFVVYHLDPVTDHGSDNSNLIAQRIRTIDDAMRRLGLRYTLNNEFPNFVKSAEITPGVNEFAHPDGTHRWDLRMDWLGPVLPPAKPALLGITYDECEHMQLTCNQFAYYPDQKPFDAPFLVDTTGKDLETAYNRLVAKCKWLRTRHYRIKGDASLFSGKRDASPFTRWVIVDSFADPAVARALKPYLGPPDVARFRFRDFTIEFRAKGDKDTVEVTVTPGPTSFRTQ